MRFVLSLIGPPGSRQLGPALIEAAGTALAEAGARVGAPDWLEPGDACDLPFEAVPPETAEIVVRARLAGAPVDVAAQPQASRRRRLLVADMESTIIGQELLDELAAMVGLGPKIAAITARTMAGELDFAASLRARVALLAGMPAARLAEVERRITLNPGARTLVQTMRASGAYTALVSGGFACFAEAVGVACGFDETRANSLTVEAGRLTGTVAEPILGANGKQRVLEELAARGGHDLSAACAVGDGANDLPMVRAAGLGVAYRGKPVLREAARYRLDQGDLTGLLFLQGYRRAEFRARGNGPPRPG